ncbi:hypothetical protein FPHOBKDP_00184 [Listeria phage LPJP1]|nr:hypothetical protein FPHOBKDP_00184 [Listeria phage LPJP1]
MTFVNEFKIIQEDNMRDNTIYKRLVDEQASELITILEKISLDNTSVFINQMQEALSRISIRDYIYELLLKTEEIERDPIEVFIMYAKNKLPDMNYEMLLFYAFKIDKIIDKIFDVDKANIAKNTIKIFIDTFIKDVNVIISDTRFRQIVTDIVKRNDYCNLIDTDKLRDYIDNMSKFEMINTDDVVKLILSKY